jgi:hypothetical protein
MLHAQVNDNAVAVNNVSGNIEVDHMSIAVLNSMSYARSRVISPMANHFKSRRFGVLRVKSR